MDASKYVGKTITSVIFGDDERIILSFTDSTKIAIFDGGQSCCEHRHMSTDDDLGTLVGGTLTHITERDGSDIESDYVHEICFVEVGTNKGFITLVNHNEHNGYYGGFALRIQEL